jgi:hypothetical protein
MRWTRSVRQASLDAVNSLTTMSTYRGPAVLITDEGVEFTVGANLSGQSRPRPHWSGTLTIAGQHWDAVKNKGKGFRLRIGNREAPFHRPNPSEMPPSSPESSFWIRVLGDDHAPF